MDSKRETRPRETRRQHSEEFRQALVRRSLVSGASVAAIELDAGVNAKLLFNGRRLHLQARTHLDTFVELEVVRVVLQLAPRVQANQQVLWRLVRWPRSSRL